MSNSPSSTTSSMNIADRPASRIAIGREIPDNPASLAAASPAKLPGDPASDSINSGFTVSSQVPAPAAKYVDANHLEGSNKGDHRAPANKADLTAPFKNSPGPRDAARQFQNSGNDPGTAPFQSTVDATDAAN